MACVAVMPKGIDSEIVIALNDVAYLCNDQGQTIERLRPAVRDEETKPEDMPNPLSEV